MTNEITNEITDFDKRFFFFFFFFFFLFFFLMDMAANFSNKNVIYFLYGNLYKLSAVMHLQPSSVAHCMRVRLVIRGLRVGNILSRRLIMKYFLRAFSPFRCFKNGSCQFLAKECAQY